MTNRNAGFPALVCNHWENGKVKPSKLAKAQIDEFCTKMTKRGTLNL